MDYYSIAGAQVTGRAAAALDVPNIAGSAALAAPTLVGLFAAASARFRVPLALLLCQASQESAFNPSVVSFDGGYGIAQFTYEPVARHYLGVPSGDWHAAALDPARAIPAQAWFMSDLKAQMGGTWWGALAGYNGGPNGAAIPAAAQYASGILSRAQALDAQLPALLPLSAPSAAGGSTPVTTLKTASWTPRHAHVSQLFHRPSDPPGVWGDNDCAEASLTRYLRECLVPFAGDDQALIARLRREIVGQATDGPANTYTGTGQLEAWMRRAGIPVAWHPGAGSLRAPWALCLVNAQGIRPVFCPSSWLDWADGSNNHFILCLPSGLYDNPLTYAGTPPAMVDAAIASFGAVAGAYLLPDPSRVSWRVDAAGAWHMLLDQPQPKPQPKPAPAPQPAAPKKGYLIAAQWAKKGPSVEGPAIPGCHIPADKIISVYPGTVKNREGTWRRVLWGRYTPGYVLDRYVRVGPVPPQPAPTTSVKR